MTGQWHASGQVRRLFAPLLEQARLVFARYDGCGSGCGVDATRVYDMALRWVASLSRQYPYNSEVLAYLILQIACLK
jgi:hypothetical protein